MSIVIPVVSTSGAKSSVTLDDPTVTGTTSTTVKIGETNVIGGQDSGNATTVGAQSFTVPSGSPPLQSLSFYVEVPAGQLYLGVYDATGPNGGPGALRATTVAFTAVTGWNTQPVITPVTLAAGTYWLARSPSSDALVFRYDPNAPTSDGRGEYFERTSWGALPATFSTATNKVTGHWSAYATFSGTVVTPPPPPPPPPPLPSNGALQVPSNVRLRGANFSFSFNNGVGGMGGEGGMWVVFPWLQWIKPQLDDIAALGGNCIRLWGSPQPVGFGSITTSVYLDRWRQVLNYCATKGIYVYACGGDLGRWGVSDSAAVQIYSDWAGMLAEFPSTVIGVDLTNEAPVKCLAPPYGSLNPNVVLALLGKLKNAVSAKGVPAANSSMSIIREHSTAWDETFRLGVDLVAFHAMGDFIDWHVYDSYTWAEMSVAYSTPGLSAAIAGKDVFFGEFGGVNATDYATSAAHLRSMSTLISSQSRHVGGTFWAAWDYDDDDAWRYGLYGITWGGSPLQPTARTARTTVTVPFTGMPKTR